MRRLIQQVAAAWHSRSSGSLRNGSRARPVKWSWPPPLAVSGRGAKIASKGPSLTGTREGKGRMPKRQAARDRAQAELPAVSLDTVLFREAGGQTAWKVMERR